MKNKVFDRTSATGKITTRPTSWSIFEKDNSAVAVNALCIEHSCNEKKEDINKPTFQNTI